MKVTVINDAEIYTIWRWLLLRIMHKTKGHSPNVVEFYQMYQLVSNISINEETIPNLSEGLFRIL